MIKGESKGSRLRRWWWLGVAALFSNIRVAFTTIGIVVVSELIVNDTVLDYEVRRYAAFFFVACSYGFAWLVEKAGNILIKERK